MNALNKMTGDEKERPLDLAIATRRERSQLKKDLKAGRNSAYDVLLDLQRNRDDKGTWSVSGIAARILSGEPGMTDAEKREREHDLHI